MKHFGRNLLYGTFLLLLASGLVYGNTSVMTTETYNTVKLERWL